MKMRLQSLTGTEAVFVGDDKRDTAAHYFLKSPAEVAAFLGMLLEQTQETLVGSSNQKYRG